jgi:hypothetical protein
LEWGTVGGRKREWGGKGEFTSNLGPEWTGIAPHKEGFQVNERDLEIREGSPGKGEIMKGTRQGVCAMCSDIVNLVYIYISCYCVYVANERIVFRL